MANPDAPSGAKTVLLPCPFCGRKPTINKVKAGYCQLHGEKMYKYVVSCKDHAIFSDPNSQEEAVHQWNTRAAPPGRLPSPAAPRVEAIASLDEMADRLRQRVGTETGVFMSLASARANLAYAFTGLVSDDTALSALAALLARLAPARTENLGAAPSVTEIDGAGGKSTGGAVDGRLREAITEALHWHERADKALSKSGEKGADVQWRRVQHQEQAEALRAALAEAPTRDGWRFDMEAAPRDEEDVLVFCVDTQQQFIAFWNGQGWQYARAREGYPIICEPDAWRPLPDAPVRRPGQGGGL